MVTSIIGKENPFQKDRQQSRDLQLQGWCVLRFAGREILNETDAVVRTIEQAIRRKARGREDQEKQPRMRMPREKFPLSGAFAAGLVAAVVLMILIESFFPALFYHLTAGF